MKKDNSTFKGVLKIVFEDDSQEKVSVYSHKKAVVLSCSDRPDIYVHQPNTSDPKGWIREYGIVTGKHVKKYEFFTVSMVNAGLI